MAKITLLPPDPLYCLKDAMGHVHSMCFPVHNQDFSSQLLAATEKGDVFFWDLETNRLQHKQPMGKSIQTIHSLKDYDIVTHDKSGLVKLWSIQNNSGYKINKSFQSYGGFCKSVLFNDQIILPRDRGGLALVDLDTFESVKCFVPDEGEKVGNVMCSQPIDIRGTSYLLAGYETGDLILWDYNTAKQCSRIKLNEFMTSVTFDPYTHLGVCSNSSNALQVFHICPETFDIVLKCELTLTNPGCNIVKFRPDKRLLFAGGWDGRLRVYSWRSLRQLAVLTEHKKAISDIQFSPYPVRFWESNITVAAGEDGMISLWNVYHNYTY